MADVFPQIQPLLYMHILHSYSLPLYEGHLYLICLLYIYISLKNNNNNSRNHGRKLGRRIADGFFVSAIAIYNLPDTLIVRELSQ
jgi:hypothetical protein